MITATGIAIARALRVILLTGLSGIVLVACGGGAQTTDNPLPNNPGPTSVVYNGLAVPRDADVQAYLANVWTPMHNGGSCGNCHNESVGQTPMFARMDDINMAYDDATTVADKVVPSNSRLVTKVGSGHNCWLTSDQACANIMTTWIERWAGATSGGGRQITLNPPPSVNPGDSKNYANASVQNFANLVHGPILTTYCAGCHSSQSATSQSPYFAEADAAVAFDAAKPKMDLDIPADSRFVIRLGSEFHNCWSQNCASDSAAMQAAIQAFADTVPITQIDPALVNSKALRIVDGTVASGGNRHEIDQIALWEFKTGSGTTAFDTSGITPALDLTLSGQYEWFGGWGITIGAGMAGTGNGKAQGSTAASGKLNTEIRKFNEFSIEAWVVPNNVTQELARIVTYSGGDTARNFTLQQTLYNYDFRQRTSNTGLNGDPQLSTPDADEVLQATLQHVVATYSPVDGRRIFVNGQLATQPDPVPPGSLVDWQDTFAFVLGNEASGDAVWEGTLRMVAIHNRALTPTQIQQNFDVGVGEKFFLLFSIEDIINVPTAYILFEASQFDSYAYLFTRPHFITLDPAQSVNGVPIQGIRIGVNGAEVDKSQSYANIDDMLDTGLFQELGQPLSALGAVIPLEKGPADDEFFLTFDLLGTQTYVRTDDPPLVITPADLPAAPRIGVRTFDEINATFAAVTNVNPLTPSVDMTYQNLRQSLPAVDDVKAFLSSQQVAIAQLAFEYCNALVDGPNAAAYFNNFNFNVSPATAYAGTNRNQVIDPLIDNIMGIAILTQPDFVAVRDEVGYVSTNGVRPDNLIDRMMAPNADPLEPQANTRGIAKGVCGAILGSAVTLVQ
jgi:hypothetical protein